MGRSPTVARIAASIVIAAPTWKATLKPSVSAIAVPPPAPRELDAAIVLRIARPSAPPNSREVFNRPEASPLWVRGTPCVAAIVEETSVNPMPSPGEDPAGGDQDEVAATGPDTAQRQQAGSCQEHAQRHNRSHTETGDEPRSEPGPGEHRERHRQEGQARRERIVAEHLLQIQRDEEEHREQGRVHQDHDQVGGPEPAQPEDRQWDQRGHGDPGLDDQEAADQSQSGEERHEHARRSPSERIAADDPEREADESRGDQDSAGEVEVTRSDATQVGWDHAWCEREDEHAERHVDREDRRPSEHLREHAAEQRAGGGAEAADGAPQAKAAVALRAFTKRRGDDRERGWGHDSTGEALQCADRDQHLPRLCGCARERGDREQRNAGEEHPPAAEQIGGAGSEQHETSERDRVGVDDPLQAGRREMQAVAHLRQRDVDDCDIEDDHELRQADHEQECVGGVGPVWE